MTVAYVYKLTHKPSLKWYIGSRTAKNCHPDDGYICSSKIVKPLFLTNPDEWTREILFTGEPKEILTLESELLELFDAKNDPRSYNQHNGDGKFTRIGIPGWNKGQILSDVHRAKIGVKSKGRIKSDEARKKISESKKGNKNWLGKHLSDDHKKKLSFVMKELPLITCPHCNKSMTMNNIKRWHFDNCKLKDNE